MLQAALALSRENNGQTTAPAPPPSAPAAESATTAASAQARLQARVKEIFLELTQAGLPPNEAAAQALERATKESKEQATTTAPKAPAQAEVPIVNFGGTNPALLEKAGFEARVKELFAAHKAAGEETNEAAAMALKQAQQEQLAAAQAARRERSGGHATPARNGNDGSGGSGSSPPEVGRQGSEAVEAFERWEEIERVAQVHVDAIIEMYRSDGVKFVDPTFPPTDKALYCTPDSATHWKCRACGHKNKLPPPPTDQDLLRLMTDRSAASEMIKCANCGSESSKLETALRPAGWMRPGDIPGIRDDVTLQYSSVPWVVIRDEPRSDDIRQGHVGKLLVRLRDVGAGGGPEEYSEYPRDEGAYACGSVSGQAMPQRRVALRSDRRRLPSERSLVLGVPQSGEALVMAGAHREGGREATWEL